MLPLLLAMACSSEPVHPITHEARARVDVGDIEGRSLEYVFAAIGVWAQRGVTFHIVEHGAEVTVDDLDEGRAAVWVDARGAFVHLSGEDDRELACMAAHVLGVAIGIEARGEGLTGSGYKVPLPCPWTHDDERSLEKWRNP